MFEVTYPNQAIKIQVEKGVKFASVSTGLKFKKQHQEDVLGTKLNSCLKFRVPDTVDVSKLVELTVTSKHSEIYLHWVCRKNHEIIKDDDTSNVLGIDIGLNNFVTCIPNTGKQGFIINGRPLKAINQFYNKINIWIGKKLPSSKSTAVSSANGTIIGVTVHEVERSAYPHGN